MPDTACKRATGAASTAVGDPKASRRRRTRTGPIRGTMFNAM